ncbi:MAG TPA: antitoxin Xre/MbcA/ParS toxin-binding domain-containing protein [Candidatus Baltobacteraceae bacterium]
MALPATTLVEGAVTPAQIGSLLKSRSVSRAGNPRELSDEVRRGLPASTIGALRDVGYAIDEIARITANSARTIQRYLVEKRRTEKLNLATSDRVVRLAAMTLLATRLVGTQEKALAWLRASNRYLGGVTPLEMLETEVGTQAVVQSLYSIAYGGVA